MAYSFLNLLLAIFGLLLATATLLLLNSHSRGSRLKGITSWVQGGIKTPLLRENPEKNEKMARRSSCATELKDIFPPSSREALALAAKSLPEVQRNKLRGHKIDLDEIRKNLIPFEADYRQCGQSTYTPTGISMQEIKTLGDFPDYATLTGVPLPEPYKDFDITRAKARPYRPFRWAYHQTMSLSKLEPNHWLELDSTYPHRLAQRRALLHLHGRAVLDSLPGSELACREVMSLALQFLAARYPAHFSLTYSPFTKTHVFENRILGTSTRTDSKHPLHVLLENVSEDFAIMIRNPDTGVYHLRAAVLCSALGWSVATKLGLSLGEIHAPVVPDYESKMAKSMDRYFAKLQCEKPIQRGSWGLEVGEVLFMPPGDAREEYRGRQDEGLDAEEEGEGGVKLRVDWQTLRRLPCSGGVVFNFRALFTPISDLRNEPYIPALLHKVLTEGNREIMKYKNTWHVEHKVLPLLEQWKREQEESGVVERGWEVRTLEESPFFPGWDK